MHALSRYREALEALNKGKVNDSCGETAKTLSRALLEPVTGREFTNAHIHWTKICRIAKPTKPSPLQKRNGNTHGSDINALRTFLQGNTKPLCIAVGIAGHELLLEVRPRKSTAHPILGFHHQSWIGALPMRNGRMT